MAVAMPDRDEDFRDILNAVLDRMQSDFGITDEEVAEAVSSVVVSLKFGEGNRFSDVNYDQPQNVCGYLSRYGVHGASITRERVLEAAGACEVLKKTLQESEGGKLMVISLGGGPGNDALGFCSALADLDFPADRGLQVIVEDHFGGWQECVDRMIPVVQEGPFGKLTDLFKREEFTMKFLDVDILQDTSARTADIVLLQKVLSILLPSEIPRVAEKIRQSVKPGGFLFLIDSNLALEEGKLVYRIGQTEREHFQNLQLLHLSESGDHFGGIYSWARLALLHRPPKKKANEENEAAAKRQKTDSPKTA